MASGDFIAQAIGGIGNAIASIDPMRDQTAKLEYELKQATLANIQADTAARLRATQSIGGAPVSTGARNVTARPSLAREPLPERFGRSMTPEIVAPEVVNPWPMGWGRTVDPNTPNAEAFEERYGDIVGSLIGTGVTLWNDAPYLLKDWPMPPVLGRLYHGDKRPRLKKAGQ
uniref:hypothetical protein n=1 Tax=Aminobacter niigataensis TaxID=83265 RepID=UPI002852852E|nr:hypothetical protein [Aminobacter niigataensis]